MIDRIVSLDKKFIEMKNILLLIAPFLCFSQTVWDGPLMTFTKQNYENPALEDSQDRITELIWITRGDSNVLFNAKTQSSAPIDGYASPADTQWAEGNTNNLTGLVFSDFKSAAPKFNGTPRVKDMVGRNYVVHLVTDNIYIDLKMLSWQQYKNGGGFSYERSTNPNLNAEFKDAIDVFVYPNPTTGFVHANQNIISQICVYDIKGRQLMRSNALSVDLSAFKNGIYILKLYRSDTKNWVTKHIIKNQKI